MWLAGFFSPKARRGLKGSRQWRQQLAALQHATGDVFHIHFHAASVGEFEQAKPLIEGLRSEMRRYRITASFFSPSGYEQQGRYAALDAASYLPRDSRSEMSDFLDVIAPRLIVIIRYDLWPGLLVEARRRGIPVVLACGVLREDSSRFNPFARGFFRNLYALLSLIHAVGPADAGAFGRLVPEIEVETSGDTRYDRVMARAHAAADLPVFTTALIAGRTVLVAGSTWSADEELLIGLAQRNDLLLVLVPHEPTPEHVGALLKALPGSIPLSQLEGSDAPDHARVIVVDRTGILSALYRIGHLAYVGGGFGDGVHSVLEPAAYGIPVFCGPRIERSRDAEEMHAAGGLVVVRRADELALHVQRLIADDAAREEHGARVREFVEQRTGAAGRIIASLHGGGLISDD